MKKLSHLGDDGRAHMVDVGAKAVTSRRAVASASVRISAELHGLLISGRVPKGDVLGVARVAGIMAAKRTSELIPLCHPLPLDSVSIELTLEARAVAIRATVTTSGKTGVEMEALTAASVAALTLYDMCKSVDRRMTIVRVQLEEKSGGKGGTFRRKGPAVP